MVRHVRKMYGRQCERCHCTLDPGEGRYCEECLEDQKSMQDRDLMCYGTMDSGRKLPPGGKRRLGGKRK